MTWSGRRLRWLSCAVLLAPTALMSQPTAPATRVRLVRCLPHTDVSCVALSLSLPAATRARLASFDSAQENTAWSASLGGTRLLGAGVQASPTMSPSLRLLVLVDESAGMGDEGLTFSRIALSAFVRSLDSTSVSVAIATFGSRDVARRIDTATFTTPRAALARLDQFPQSAQQPRAALFSALSAGVARTEREVAPHPGLASAVLVLSPGVNQVSRTGDDPGLLQGTSGFERASTNVAASRAAVWFVHVTRNAADAGLVALLPDSQTRTLATLCGPACRLLQTRRDPNAITNALLSLSRALRPERTLVFGAPVLAGSSLARMPLSGVATLHLPDGDSLSTTITWRPPIFGLPLYAGTADTAAMPAEVRDVLGAGALPANTRLLISLLLVVTGTALWLFLPRLLWGGQSETADDVTRRSAIYGAATSTQELLLARGPAPREGAPRSPGAPTVPIEHLRRPTS